MVERLERLVSQVLPRRGDRIAAGALLVIALGPIVLLGVMWGIHDRASAQLRWIFGRVPRWPYPTAGGPLSGNLWYPTTHVDPWGTPYVVEDPDDDDASVVSAGPNRTFELGKGDDIEVAGFFFLGVAHLLILLAVGGVLSSGAGALLYLAWRQAFLPRSPRLEVELARAAVISLPLLPAVLGLVFWLGLHRVAGRASLGHASPAIAVACTVAFVVYLAVLYLRIRRERAPDA